MKKILSGLILLAITSVSTRAQVVNLTGNINSINVPYTLPSDTGFTIEYWVNPVNLNTINPIVSSLNTQNSDGLPYPITSSIDVDGYMTVSYGDGNNIFGSNTCYSFQFTTGTWTHVVHTYDQASSSAKLYVDESLVLTIPVSGTLSNDMFLTELFFGNRPDISTDSDIRIRDIRIWRGEQFPSYGSCLTGAETNLNVYYKTDEGTGTLLTDLALADGSQNGNIGGTFTWETLQAPGISISSPATTIYPGEILKFTSTLSGDVFFSSRDWQKNATSTGYSDVTYDASGLLNGDQVTAVLSSGTGCIPTSIITSNTIIVSTTPLPANAIPYNSFIGCYEVGNLAFCDLLAYDYQDFYQGSNGVSGSAADEASILSTSQSDAYDGAFEIAIDDSAFSNTLNGAYIDTLMHVVQSDTQLIRGLSVRKEFRILQSKPIIRFRVQLQNPTAADKTVRLSIASNLGSDSGTEVDSSSLGNTTINDSTRWMTTWDGGNGPDPVLSWARFGKGHITSQPYFESKPEAGNDDYIDTVSITIPAHSTRYYVMFNRLDSTTSAARLNAGLFDSLQAMLNDSLFDGIDSLANVVNWSFAQPVADLDKHYTKIGCDTLRVAYTNQSINADSLVWDFGDGSPLSNQTNPVHFFSIGTFITTLTAYNANGFMSSTTNTVTVTHVTIDNTTTVTSPGISSNEVTATSYQWIDCTNGNASVIGATGQSFTATSSGSYAVIAGKGTCYDTSACVNITIVGLAQQKEPSSPVKIYPNPGSGIFTLETSEISSVFIYNELGEQVYFTRTKTGTNVIDLTHLSTGMYTIKVSTGNGFTVKKYIKQ